MVNQQIYLPMIPDSAPIVVNISQNDFDAAGYAGRLFFNLVNNGVAYDMDGATAIFQGEKPDGTTFAYPATVVNDSVVRVNVRQQMTVVSGRVVCQLVLNNTDGQIGSFNIWLEVQPSGAAGGDPSQTDIPALIAQAHEYADQAEQAAINAAAWSANPPYIGANGNWFVYDADAEAYVDTGVYASGTEGSLWYTGTAVNGKDVNPSVFPTGIATAREHDMYLNKTEGAIYECTFGGADTVAKWAYVMTLSGGGGGASDYPDLGMKPEINGNTLLGGNQTGASLGLQNTLETGDGIDITGTTISVKLSEGTNVSLTTQPDGTIEISATGGGGGMLPYLYIDSEAGATVTVNQPDGTTITPTAAGSGHWECELTAGYGVYTIHSVLSGQGDATASLTVDTVKEYHVTDNHYDHTINVTAPNGSTVRVTNGTETYTGTGTGSAQAYVVHTASSTYTISVTLDGNTKTDTVTTPSTTAQSSSVTIQFGTITVAVDADFVTAGSSITCVSGGTSCTAKTAASTLTFRPPTTGTWTISGTIGTKTYTVDATVSSLSTAVSVSLKTKALMYSFETCTDQQLADMLESYYNGAYDATDIALLKSTYMPIGAKRSISLSAMDATGVSESHHADNYDVVIIGHEHDDLKTASSGGKTKAFLTLQLDRILYKNTTDATYSSNYPAVADEGGYMNSTNTNVGGWTNCARRSWCNDVFLNALPTAVKNLVKTVNKLTSAGNQSATIETTEDDAFLLSEIEIFGAVTYSKAGEGSQYEYFTTASNIQKKPSYQSYVSAYWWERSPNGSNATHFCSVHFDGAASYDSASIAFGLAPAFCI